MYGGPNEGEVETKAGARKKVNVEDVYTVWKGAPPIAEDTFVYTAEENEENKDLGLHSEGRRNSSPIAPDFVMRF